MIPNWNIQGLLPPIKPGEAGNSPIRSPYENDIVTLIDHFAISQERCNILDGLLRYRQALCEAGISEGFQWLDGSFMQNIETQESRPPNDIDVVTFLIIPDNPDNFDEKRLRELFNSESTKLNFFVDAYPFQLNVAFSPTDIKMIAYWYSMWSHTREGIWKGFVQVMLDCEKDEEAMELLAAIKREKGYE